VYIDIDGNCMIETNVLTEQRNQKILLVELLSQIQH